MKYNELINQEPLMCVPACLLMILKRRNLDNNLSQKDIAKFLNFHTSKKLKDQFKEFPVAEIELFNGCNVTDLNKQFFIPASLPLKEKYLSIEKLEWGVAKTKKTMSILTKELLYLSGEVDIMVSLDYSKLDSTKDKTLSHVVILESITDDFVTLIIPFDTKPTERVTITMNELLESMKGLSRGNGGFWIIK